MRIAKRIVLCIAATAIFGTTAACSSGPDGTDTTPGNCTAYTSTADLSQPVSFRKDVMPILHMSCGGCHKSGMNATPHSLALTLGDAGVEEPSGLRTKLVGVMAAELPDMALIAPGDPANSFLMHKMDDDQCTLAAECNAGALGSKFPNCGNAMPPVAASMPPKLSAATRDIVRAWIHQGAQDN
jgi:hypothetical protein